MRWITLIGFCLILVSANAQSVSGDPSFAEMCNFYKGLYQPRYNGANSIAGDICSLEFAVSHDTQESAQLFCEENVPFHIKETIFKDGITVCVAEATLICEAGWIQFFGRCYKIEKTMMTREKAEEFCSQQKPKSHIAFMHREALAYRIKDYFTSVTRVWWDASIAITKDLVHDVEGGHLLLALDGYPFGLPNVAVVRVATTEKAMVLCEYTPPMNQAEGNYLLRRYGEIYYPTIFTSTSAYVRSASSLRRSDIKMNDNEYCKKVLRPFLQTDDAQSGVPTFEFLQELTKQQKPEIIRTSVHSADSKYHNRVNGVCSLSNSTNYGMDFASTNKKTIFKSMKYDNIWRPNEPKEICDGASWSTSVVLSRDSNKGLEAMSDAMYAPIYCQTTFEVYEYGDCEQGYYFFNRKSTGQKLCYLFFGQLMTFDEAEATCQNYGSRVSGFADQEELDFLDSILNQYSSNTQFGTKSEYNVWLGTKRRPNCNRKQLLNGETGFSRNPDHPCSRERVFEWVNGVAENPPDFKDRWADPNEPNFQGDDEQCVELLKGPQFRWNNGYHDKELNDIPCLLRRYFFCSKEAPVIAVREN